ncbi:LuxR C-terminal-related transcriptional regulator [Nocardia halotolerans]|uniref:LuxR C-terminal-related transcriptional regulator n=1 Tax=Nocardia halotolerans TaxID=1755878 RepID=A0ABV8VHA0_9NOCA
MTAAPAPAMDALLAAIDTAGDAHELFARTSTRLRRIVAFDAAVWVATDPVNGLTTAPVRVENLHEGGCGAYWESELFAEHVNLFRELAVAPVPVAGLRAVTGDRPSLSPLYRGFMRPRGFDDELRAVLRVDGQGWGQVSLFRERGRPAFEAAEIAALHTLSAPMAGRLRGVSRPQVAGPPGAHAPGLLLFAADGALLSINDEARELLAQMPPGPSTTTPSGLELPLPVWILSTAGRARLTGAGAGAGARIRIRATTGHWLVCHASQLRGASGAPDTTALVIAHAAPSDIAALVVAAYELTPRELEVTELIAAGLSTAEIAARLFVSAHTVRDHVKSVFDKAGVSSRGELVATLFNDYRRPLLEPVTQRVHDGLVG